MFACHDAGKRAMQCGGCIKKLNAFILNNATSDVAYAEICAAFKTLPLNFFKASEH